MDKWNHLDELPIAHLNEEQLKILQQAENTLNNQEEDVYLIAFKKNNR